MESNGKHILRLAAKSLGAAAIISLVMLLIGTFLQWNDPIKFSNAFFNAGAILIVLGILSIGGGFLQRSNFAILYAESAGQEGIAGRTQRMVADITQRYGTLIFMLVTGLLLIGISVAVGNFV